MLSNALGVESGVFLNTESDAQTQRLAETHGDTQRHTQTHTETHRDTQRHRDTHTHTHKQTHEQKHVDQDRSGEPRPIQSSTYHGSAWSSANYRFEQHSVSRYSHAPASSNLKERTYMPRSRCRSNFVGVRDMTCQFDMR